MGMRAMGRHFMVNRLLPVMERIARASYEEGVADAKAGSEDVDRFWEESENNAKKELLGL